MVRRELLEKAGTDVEVLVASSRRQACLSSPLVTSTGYQANTGAWVLYQSGHVSARYKSTQGMLVTGGWVLAQLQARFGERALPHLEKLKRELNMEHMEGAIEISPALANAEEDFTDEMEALEPHPTPRTTNHQLCQQRLKPPQNHLILHHGRLTHPGQPLVTRTSHCSLVRRSNSCNRLTHLVGKKHRRSAVTASR